MIDWFRLEFWKRRYLNCNVVLYNLHSYLIYFFEVGVKENVYVFQVFFFKNVLFNVGH